MPGTDNRSAPPARDRPARVTAARCSSVSPFQATARPAAVRRRRDPPAGLADAASLPSFTVTNRRVRSLRSIDPGPVESHDLDQVPVKISRAPRRQRQRLAAHRRRLRAAAPACPRTAAAPGPPATGPSTAGAAPPGGPAPADTAGDSARSIAPTDACPAAASSTAGIRPASMTRPGGGSQPGTGRWPAAADPLRTTPRTPSPARRRPPCPGELRPDLRVRQP